MSIVELIIFLREEAESYKKMAMGYAKKMNYAQAARWSDVAEGIEIAIRSIQAKEK